MTTKNIKIVLFMSLIVAMVLPFSGMDFASGQTINKIDKPQQSASDIAQYNRVVELVTERIDLEAQGEEQKQKYQKDGIEGLTTAEIKKLEAITKRLGNIEAEIGTINNDSTQLYAMTQSEIQKFKTAQNLIDNSEIPTSGSSVDQRNGALMIGFKTQEEADKFIPDIENLIDVPYYVEVNHFTVEDSCTNIDSDCNPLMGGIQIWVQYSGSSWGECSYSIPAVRNVFWWTETGFVTAGHCFSGNNGNDVKQPISSSTKIGDLTARVVGGECDCAFVKKSGSESTLFGNWWGTGSSNQLLSKSDPLVGNYVVMIGEASGIKVGKVISNTYTSTSSSSTVTNTLLIDYFASTSGDSGGTLIDKYAVFSVLFKKTNIFNSILDLLSL